MKRLRRHLPALVIGLAASLALGATVVDAWHVQSQITDGCHERLTYAALDASQYPGGARPPALTTVDARVVSDVPFTLPTAHQNIWDATMVLGSRAVDLGPFEPVDLADLADWHARPDLQPSHCLRSPSEDYARGDVEALADCHAHIKHEVELALGPGDAPDLDAREPNRVFLSFRRSVVADLPRYPYHVGIALHALQDAFSHQFRDPNNLAQVRSVLNYTDYANGRSFNAARDGHQHLTYMDTCRDFDDLQTRRLAAGVRASTELLDALADGTGGRAGRLARVEEILVHYLSLDTDPGHVNCGAANAWCDAPEPALAAEWEQARSCSVSAPGGGRAGEGGALAAVLLALGALGVRRRLRGSSRAVVAVVLAALAWTAVLPSAQADTITPAPPAPPSAPAHRRFGVLVSARGALEAASVGVALGARYELAEFFTVGVDVEFNPWLDFGGGQATSPGTLDLFATGIVVWGVAQKLELRSTLHLGMTYLLDDLYDAPSGSVGPFLGFVPVGLAVRLGEHFRLIVDPGVMIPMPSLRTIPLVRVEYGLLVGLQWNP